MKMLWSSNARSPWLPGMALGLLLMLGLPLDSLFAGGENGYFDVELNKSIDTTFQVSKGLRVDLENRYGNVAVTTWERNEVRVQIDVRIREKDAEAAAEGLESVRLYQLMHGNLIRLNTAMGYDEKGLKKFWREISSFGEVKLDVDYQLTLPAYAELRIKNEFGDVYLEGLTAPFTINLDYGNLRVRNVPRSSKIEIEGGKAYLGEAPDLRVLLEDAELDLREVGALELTSRGSEVFIDRAERIRWESKRDRGRIDRVGTIDATGHFSDLVIEELLDVGDLDWTLGKLDIEKLGAYCQELSLSQKNADVELNVEGLDFDLQAYLEGGKLIAPKELGTLNVELLDVKREIRTITTRIGTGRSRIELEGKGGQVALFR